MVTLGTNRFSTTEGKLSLSAQKVKGGGSNEGEPWPVRVKVNKKIGEKRGHWEITGKSDKKLAELWRSWSIDVCGDGAAGKKVCRGG